ncbi:MAG: phosphate ABC transporter permease PstA [Alphaproteobacteria bacterium]|nr:phosphate ABC transporter permease PstA [Alphaproteobacteria bacterium]
MTEFSQTDARKAQLAKRYRAETRFKAFGIGAICTAGLILLFLMGSILISSLPAFTQHYVTLDIEISERHIDTQNLADSDWRGLARASLRAQFPDVQGRRDKRALGKLLSLGASDDVRDYVLANPSSLGTSVRLPVTSSDDIDLLLKGVIDRELPENERVVSNQDLAWLDQLVAEGRISRKFATKIFTNGDSREPELAGLRGALVGTLWTLLVTLLASFPLGVMAAIYLEEIAPKNRLTRIIEVNINNLAAVPSIVFGLLGLAVFINFFGMPRSAPLVGGLVLALMTLPRIIIPTRAAFAAIPPSIREAAMGVGASRLQVIMHHVLPLAMPGILTGTIIGLAQAAGETAPLLMIGMMAFIVDVPTDVTAKATVLPAQIYMWANNPERAFMARTSAGIVVLLSLLLLVNATAIYFRKRFEKRW